MISTLYVAVADTALLICDESAQFIVAHLVILVHVGMVMEIHGTYKLTYHPVEGDSEKVFEVDFTPPFRRVSMIPELEKQLSVTFPPATEFHTPGGLLCTCFYSLFWIS